MAARRRSRLKFTPLTPEIQALLQEEAMKFPDYHSSNGGNGNYSKLALHRGVCRPTIRNIKYGTVKTVSSVTMAKLFPGRDFSDLEWYSRKELQQASVFNSGAGRPIYTKEIGGKLHKLCCGPAHKRPTYIELERFTTIKSGKRKGYPRSRCRACETISKGAEPMLPAILVIPALQESINRLGVMEVSRRSGMPQPQIWQIEYGKVKKVHAKTARTIIALRDELRRTGEIRHKDSIQHGAYLRGRKEKVPTKPRDHYSRIHVRHSVAEGKLNARIAIAIRFKPE